MYSWRYLEYRYLHLYTSDKLYIFKIKQILYNRESNKGMSSESEEENKEMKIIMLGAPGAGKGTQAKKISDKYEIPHISTGDIFRANIKNGTELILDGCPRTIPQAECLTEALNERNEKMDYAVNVDVPDENIISRMSGRRACLNCGATYHIVNIPTKKPGICDRCGEPVVLRDDDKPETVKKRLDVYHAQTKPLIDYYGDQGILKTVDGTLPMETVFDEIVKMIEA